MKKLLIASSLGFLLAASLQAQNTTLAFQPGKLVVFRGGDGTTNFTFTARRWPCYLDEYDPSTPNQASPLMTFTLDTNGANSLWINLHAGSEGQAISRSMNRAYLTISGYHGDINGTNVGNTPSSSTDCTRGIATVDAFTNFTMNYQANDWFGLQGGITQNNPRGIATDGTNNFWGCGTIAGTASGTTESGTLFWSPGTGVEPVQNQCESGYQMRIIGGVLYMVVQNEAGGGFINGVYDFVDFFNNVVPLPWTPGFQDTTFTNTFLNFGNNPYNGKALKKVLTFDMDPSNSVAYAADETYGIAKYVNVDGVWNMAYMFTATNLGTLSQPSANQGIFGIAVDFSGTNPVIYATTTESADAAGDVCSNRLISIVDTNNPGTNMVVTTLAVANGQLEGFRGLDFAPDLRPAITGQPQAINTTTNVASSFTVTVSSLYPVFYQWQDNGVNVTNSSNIGGSKSSMLSFAHSDVTNDGNYTVIVTNMYGAVTSSVAAMFVSPIALPPSYTASVLKLTNYIGQTVNISASALTGTPPFTFQWYDGSTLLSEGADGNGSGYIGAQSLSTLTITNAQIADSGNYYLAVTNGVGGINVQIVALLIETQPPSIPSGGQPTSLATLSGQPVTLSVSSIVGTPPFTYQWYQGSTNPVTQLQNAGDFNNVTTSSLQINPAEPADGTNYYCVVANSAGSTTSLLASVTVIVPPPASYVVYSNQVYNQNFNSLPDPGLATVNTVGGGGPVTIGNTTYDPSNPFDFAFPIFFPDQPLDGLGLSNTMSGWYGECDAGAGQLGASCGDQTTGGIISFGLTNNLPISTDRALGLISTSTSDKVHFGLKLVNETGQDLNYIDLSYIGEYWKGGGSKSGSFKYMTFSYLVDAAGSSAPFSETEINSSLAANPVASLGFSFPGLPVEQLDPIDYASNDVNVASKNLHLSSPWTPNSALWLMWSITNAAGSGQGYGIQNLSFYASAVPVYTPGGLTSVTYSATGLNAGLSLSFTNTPGASTSFTIWGTTNIALPFNQWSNLGHPTEVPAGGYSTYDFTDPSATGKPQEFYRVTSP
ncbi:MAG TPA: immunoglobulin domain-containing protein [Verrucomicrobiae bacterium]|jgi:hypothetical protein|nr:immunoglobulin domain-containing protein [Verrucomicrobiae bacterium]